MKIGFIGLGNMGSPIARNLINAGHSLAVYNRTRSHAEALQPLGAKVAETPSEAASGAEVLMTMLADDHAVESVMFGDGGALGSLPAGAIHISVSTISVDLSRKLAKAHQDKGQHYIAGPVFGAGGCRGRKTFRGRCRADCTSGTMSSDFRCYWSEDFRCRRRPASGRT